MYVVIDKNKKRLASAPTQGMAEAMAAVYRRNGVQIEVVYKKDRKPNA
jgi:hypothetical protein